jgi:tetratricopeptide (TPR) repeat protein
MGRGKELLETIEQVPPLRRSDAEVLVMRSDALRWLGRTSEALAMARRALASDPTVSGGYMSEAFACSALGRQDEALVAFDRLIRERPRWEDGHVERACVLVRAGRAEEALRIARERWPTSGYGLWLLAEVRALIACDRFEEALALCTRWIREPPPHVAPFWWGYYQGDLLRALGRHGEAVEAIEATLTRDGDSNGLGHYKVVPLIEAGRGDEAIRYLREMRARRPEDRLRNIAQTVQSLSMLGRSQDARREAEEYLANSTAMETPDAWVYAAVGRRDDALYALRNAGAQSHIRCFSYACLCAQLGERDEAHTWLERAVVWGYRQAPDAYVHPALVAMRSEPRFAALWERMSTEIATKPR